MFSSQASSCEIKQGDDLKAIIVLNKTLSFETNNKNTAIFLLGSYVELVGQVSRPTNP